MHQRKKAILGASLFLLLASCLVHAAREPVLKQITLPHGYYWREMYLPQLTSGPSGADFMPAGDAVVYSMAGSLWLQRLDSQVARELTSGPGYDYQPDVSPDGKRVVFARQDRDATELVELDIASGKERALTRDNAVAVEPRYSPDGARIAYVSTRDSGRFAIFTMRADGSEARHAFAENRTTLRRYYYSEFDHTINPSWSPDGKRLYFVSNRDEAWGTGGIWTAALDAPDTWQRVVNEETTWAARPELSPDGRRLLYASYEGRQWHQLWLTTPDGSTPLPLTFGEFDRRNARWAPDGKRVLFISNENGNTSLWVLEVDSGERKELIAAKRESRRPMQVLGLQLFNAAGTPIAARLSVLGADGRHYAPQRGEWVRADDSFDRARQAHETHWFHCDKACAVLVPRGETRVTAWAGFERRPIERGVRIGDDDRFEELRFADNALPPEFGPWISLDQHVHMNYGGHYRNTTETMSKHAAAEDLDVVYNLIVNKEQRIPDIAEWRRDPVELNGVTIVQAQEFHTSYWGHLGVVHLSDHLLLPDFTAYRHTALASPWPHNGRVAELARKQGALVGYVHPLDFVIDPATEKTLTYTLPVDAALGNADYIEILGFSDPLITAAVWHRLLNLGFRVRAGAGTDAMDNYASLRGPIGLNRLFLNQSERTPEALKAGIRGGRGFVSNGPLIALEVDGKRASDTLTFSGAHAASYRIAMRSGVPVEHVELLVNGRVAAKFTPGKDGNGDWSGKLALDASGWMLARVYGAATPLVFDLFPYATTSPIWLDNGSAPPKAPADAAYFQAWVERIIADAKARDDWNTEQEKQATLEYLESARAKFVEAQR